MKQTISVALRDKVIERDGYACVKCRSCKRLEVHHILPRTYGGVDADYNLITLCHKCHKIAPNDPYRFFMWWAGTGLPPDWDRAVQVTKLAVYVILKRLEIDDALIEEQMPMCEHLHKAIWHVMRMGRSTTEDLADQLGAFNQYIKELAGEADATEQTS